MRKVGISRVQKTVIHILHPPSAIHHPIRASNVAEPILRAIETYPRRSWSWRLPNFDRCPPNRGRPPRNRPIASTPILDEPRPPPHGTEGRQRRGCRRADRRPPVAASAATDADHDVVVESPSSQYFPLLHYLLRLADYGQIGISPFLHNKPRGASPGRD